jgi:hypothetical protein
MKKSIVFLMILSSLFVGVKIKKWSFLFQFEFIDFPTKMINHSSTLEIVAWIILILSHIGITLILFLTNKSIQMRLLKFLPPIFILSYSYLNVIFLIFLIPFIVLWIIAMANNRKLAKANRLL